MPASLRSASFQIYRPGMSLSHGSYLASNYLLPLDSLPPLYFLEPHGTIISCQGHDFSEEKGSAIRTTGIKFSIGKYHSWSDAFGEDFQVNQAILGIISPP